ncbi:hypothetical protein INR49_021617 [Caranx melampygus]|nr:hypothetical protein INR49_021617 [Caranx melampygus]
MHNEQNVYFEQHYFYGETKEAMKNKNLCVNSKGGGRLSFLASQQFYTVCTTTACYSRKIYTWFAEESIGKGGSAGKTLCLQVSRTQKANICRISNWER